MFRHQGREQEETLDESPFPASRGCRRAAHGGPERLHRGPGTGYYGGELVYTAPPALQYEAVGVAPAPGYFWIGGGWFWESGRYGWHPGYWAAPRPGYRWAPRTWVRAGGGWRAREGHWERH